MNESGRLKPVEGQWFKVVPSSLSTGLFSIPRKSHLQEEVRLLILDAFNEVEKNPDRYKKVFFTLVPDQMESGKTIRELETCATLFNGSMADWVEQSLEWAQRISNGETWEDLCFKPDNMSWYRLVRWKGSTIRFVGGTTSGMVRYPATAVGKSSWLLTDMVYHALPLIVKYE